MKTPHLYLHVFSVFSATYVPDLIDVEQELFDMPQKVRVLVWVERLLTGLKERVVYNKEVQTAALEEDAGPSIEEIREQLRQEYEQAQQAQKDQELEEEAAKLDKEIEQEIRGW